CSRAIGRSAASITTDTTRKAAHSMVAPAPVAERSAATKAPTAKGARNRPIEAISPIARITAAISQSTQGSMSLDPMLSEGLRGQQRSGKVVRVERPQILELLADSDQLDGNAELVGDGQRDAALGRAVELGEDDSGDPDGLAEELRLADA